MLLYMPFSVAIFLWRLLYSLYTSGASRWWYCEGCDW